MRQLNPVEEQKLEEQKFKNLDMPLEQFKKIIDEVGPDVLTLRLYHWGEPLVHKDFFKMVRYAKKHNIFTLTSSNLGLLTPKMADEMIDSHLDYLIISFNAATEETYSEYTGGGDFKKVVGNIKYLMKRKKEMKSKYPFVNLQFIPLRINEHEIDKIKKLAKEIGVDKLSFKTCHVPNPEAQKKIDVTNPKLQINAENKNKHVNWCEIPWQECIVCANGDTTTCTVDIFNSELMGNAFQKSFKDIWNGERFQKFRKRVKEDKYAIGICRYCQKTNNRDVFIEI
tara:strand:- start:790 stop:1638 length:849 start_codon:yes stop_codon:yes gene_type:complete